MCSIVAIVARAESSFVGNHLFHGKQCNAPRIRALSIISLLTPPSQLYIVSRNHHLNKMHTDNLALVFGPNLLYQGETRHYQLWCC